MNALVSYSSSNEDSDSDDHDDDSLIPPAKKPRKEESAQLEKLRLLNSRNCTIVIQIT